MSKSELKRQDRRSRFERGERYKRYLKEKWAVKSVERNPIQAVHSVREKNDKAHVLAWIVVKSHEEGLNKRCFSRPVFNVQNA